MTTSCEQLDGRRDRPARRRYRTVFDHSRDGIFLADGDGRVLDANPALLGMVGYGRASVGGALATRRATPVETIRDADTAMHAAKEAGGGGRSALQLQVTEHVLMEDSAAVRETLSELADQGIGLRLDDFGTRYSSVGYLSDRPVRFLKIDRSFVHDVADTVDDPGAGMPVPWRRTTPAPSWIAGTAGSGRPG